MADRTPATHPRTGPPPKAPLLGGAKKDVSLDAVVFSADVKPHLIHEAVRAEAAAARSGTHAAKTRGLVAGGRTKPWRQKGTGRARAGTIRAAQWTGGGVAFPPIPRSHAVKLNRKARKAALRGALAEHARRGSLAIFDGSAFAEPSTKAAADVVRDWRGETPLVVVADRGEETVIKSFRNLDRVLVLEPSELEIGALVWARSLLVTQGALERVQEVCSK
jgi:large subunit ribosomal protein L4